MVYLKFVDLISNTNSYATRPPTFVDLFFEMKVNIVIGYSFLAFFHATRPPTKSKVSSFLMQCGHQHFKN